MKQRITLEMLAELSEEQKERLRARWKPEEGDWYTEGKAPDLLVNHQRECCNSDYCCNLYSNPGLTLPDLTEQQAFERDIMRAKLSCLPLLSIGQCLEFLQGHNELQIRKWGDWMVYSHETGETKKPELIDALWSAVKEVL